MFSWADYEPRLVCVPSWDDAFADDVRSVVASGVQINGPDDLQDVLRESYPRVIVRTSELEGLRSRTWYVYRDGHFPWPV